MAEPVSLAEIKLHLDVVRTDQDALLAAMIATAREAVESYTGLILVRRDIAQGFACFPRTNFELSAWPIEADATVEITYLDSDGIEQVVEDSRLNVVRRPARVSPAIGASWPVAEGGTIAVTVEAGYAAPENVPEALKAAIKLTVGNLTGLRQADQSIIDLLCWPSRIEVIG